MRRGLTFRSGGLLAALFCTLGSMSFASEEKTTTLEKMRTLVKEDPKAEMRPTPLEVEWIGDIEEDDGSVTRLRLEKGQIWNGQISLVREYRGHSYGWDRPVYFEKIPAEKEIEECGNLHELEKLFGKSSFGFCATGGLDGLIQSNAAWVCISPNDEGKLTYLRVHADTSIEEEQLGKGVPRVDSVSFTRGELRPANPDSREEKKTYPSAKDLFEAGEREKARKRERLPQPLRDLIAVREHPEDPNLAHLAKAIQAIQKRAEPGTIPAIGGRDAGETS